MVSVHVDYLNPLGVSIPARSVVVVIGYLVQTHLL